MSQSSFEPLLGAPASPPADESLCRVLDMVRDLSAHTDPDVAAREYARRMRPLISTDRNLSLSRRELEYPFYRITRSDLWNTPVNPWRDRAQLPLLSGGLLGELIYGDTPRIINALELAPDDPAGEHLAGHRSLLAVPHFDQGRGLNMVVHLRKEPDAFLPAHLPQIVLLSNLFGRAIHGLVLSSQLSDANRLLQDRYTEVGKLTDTVLDQAFKLERHTRSLEETVKERTHELREAHLDAITMLAVASEAKDQDTGAHVRRIQTFSEQLARELGISPEGAERLGYSAILHDVGKMHVPDSILKKPGPLTADEREVMQQHTAIGERILTDTPFFALARRIARSHHENWDGSGYPDRLAREEIPIEVRIVHLADVYDALIHTRAYKPAWTREQATREIRHQAGKMFDPEVVRAFLRVTRQGDPA